MIKHFLWPKSDIKKALKLSFLFTSAEIIEDKLQEMFPTGFPVLCSSGRSALTFALIESNVTRTDLIGVFPYASHCVLDAISRIATPLPGPTAIKSSLRVVYHQWGYVQETNLPKNSIEDCVDSLCIPGAALFPGGGYFEVWSLPKILGTTSGGVLWCKDQETAKKIRYLRDRRRGGIFQWLLKLLTLKIELIYAYWQGAECDGGSISRFQTGEIITAIRKWDDIVDARIKNLEKIWPLSLECLDKPIDRLPSVVPIHFKQLESKIYEYGISSGFRMFERIKGNSERALLKVLPVPIHQDVTVIWLDNFIKKIDNVTPKLN